MRKLKKCGKVIYISLASDYVIKIDMTFLRASKMLQVIGGAARYVWERKLIHRKITIFIPNSIYIYSCKRTAVK